jgi:dihydropteroate synthase
LLNSVIFRAWAWETGSLAIHRKIRYWKLRSTELQLGDKTILMGVLNVTPDSFSDGGQFMDPDRAYARALQMEEEGADIIDIGAESTRPDAKRISADEEWQRLVPVLKRLRNKLGIPLSIDTYKSEIAERAFEYGVEIVNDPSGLTFDPNVAKVAAAGDAGLILNHMRGTPETWSRLGPIPDVAGTVVRELEAMASRARMAGVEKNRIALDPGLGFGKRKEQNSEIIAQLGRLVALDYPVMVGASRKAFLLALGEQELGYATAAAVAVAIVNGADIIRVHDVKAMRAVAMVADEIVRTDAAVARLADDEADKLAVSKLKKAGKKDWLEPERRPAMRAPLMKVEPPVIVPVVVSVAAAPVIVPGVAEALADDAVTEAGAGMAAADGSEPVVMPPAEGVVAADASTESAGDAEATPSAETPTAGAFGGGDRPVPKVFRKPEPNQPLYTKPQGDRPPYGDRPRFDRPQGDRPSYGGDRPRYDRPQGDRPQGDRPAYGAGRPQGDRPAYGAGRPQGDRPAYGAGRPQGDRPAYGGGRPQGDRPAYGGGRPQGDRPAYGGGRPQGDRPAYGGGRPQGDRPAYGGGRPQGDRPSFGGDRPPRRFDGDGPPRRSFGDRPQGDRPSFGGDRPGFKPGGYQGNRPDGPPKFGGGDRPGGGEWKDRGPRPGGDSRPSGGRPPFGGGQGRPPNRPFRKRP